MMVAVLIFAVFIDRRLIALMAAGASTALLFVPSIANRISYLFTSDYVTASMAGGRMVRWATAKLLLSESNPLLGFGLGRFGGAVAMQNKILEETDTFKYFYIDNYYLKLRSKWDTLVLPVLSSSCSVFFSGLCARLVVFMVIARPF